MPLPEKVVITYISRQSAHTRKVLKEDHEALVKGLKALVARKNVEREAGGEEKKADVELVKDGEGNGGGVEWAQSTEATSAQQGGNSKSSKRNI